MDYYNFIKSMIALGYTWEEIEYYYRHPEELQPEEKELTPKEKQEIEYNNYIASI